MPLYGEDYNENHSKYLRVDLTDAGSKSDLPAMIKRTGNELLEMNEADGVYTFYIKKKMA